jgi:hypothetical protein
MRRAVRFVGLLAIALVGLTCRDRSLTGPGLPIGGRLSLAPSFQQAAAGGPAIQLVSVRGVLHIPGTPPDSLVVIANFTGAGTATLQFDVDIHGVSQQFVVVLAAVDIHGDTVEVPAARRIRRRSRSCTRRPIPRLHRSRSRHVTRRCRRRTRCA